MSVAAVPCSQSSLRLESLGPWALGPAFPSPGCSASAAQTHNISPRCSGSLPAALQFPLPSPARLLADVGSSGRDGQQRCSGSCQAHEVTGFQGESDLRDGGVIVLASVGAFCSCATAATVDRSSSSSNLSDASSSPTIGPEPEPDQNQSLGSDANSPRQRKQEQQQEQRQPGPDRRPICAALSESCGTATAAAAAAAVLGSTGSFGGRAQGMGSRGLALGDAPGGGGCGGGGGDADASGGADANGGSAEDGGDRLPDDVDVVVDGGTDLAGRRQMHLHASTSSSPVSGTCPLSLQAQSSRTAVQCWPWVADPQPASVPGPAGLPGFGRHLSHEDCGASGEGGRGAVAGAVSESSCCAAALPKRASSGGSTNDRSSCSCSEATAMATVRRPAYGVKTSQITSQITAAQRVRAAVVIQAAWRGFRIRRLYLRLIVWRLRPPSWQPPADDQVYRGLQELPPIPDLPAVSLFTLYGRPSRFHGPQRRVWFGMEEVPAAGGGGGCTWRCPTGVVQLRRVAVPPRAEADVPMAEVERILSGGFWRDEPAAAVAAGDGGGGGGGDGECLSMYMRAKMRQEEREAEEALQMLSYEPHDLKHLLGSLKERTLERLGDLGRTIGETLASGRRLRGPQGQGPAAQSLPRPGWWGSSGVGSGAGGGGGGGGPGAAGQQRLYCMGQSLPAAVFPNPGIARRRSSSSQPPPHANGASAGSTHGGLTLPFSLTRALAHAIPGLGSLGGGGGGGRCLDDPSSLRVPLLHVVDAEGRTHVEVPQGKVAIAIEVNRGRYRCRSHVSRMSF